MDKKTHKRQSFIITTKAKMPAAKMTPPAAHLAGSGSIFRLSAITHHSTPAELVES